MLLQLSNLTYWKHGFKFSLPFASRSEFWWKELCSTCIKKVVNIGVSVRLLNFTTTAYGNIMNADGRCLESALGHFRGFINIFHSLRGFPKYPNSLSFVKNMNFLVFFDSKNSFLLTSYKNDRKPKSSITLIYTYIYIYIIQIHRAAYTPGWQCLDHPIHLSKKL